ncbi:MAG: TetR/AcrR family transcriptional regulator [Desulfobacterales bacterium]|nr:TetR/AcrR family transcriptional regulator [Desulfobacterales bacterium]MCP4161665.1 TetR/AcrR family transcriptional regulator [Deltaproteobacteria bacterium]
MVTKKSYHHGDLRRELIKTALQIISEDGLEKVSMRGLGQRVGVSRTAPYRHFSDKNDLLCAIAEEGFKNLANKISNSNKQQDLSPLEKLKNIGISYIEFAIANPVHYRLMFGNEILKNNKTPELVKLAEESFNGTLFAINVCQEEKIIRPLNPYIIANALWSMTHGISTLLNDGQIQAANAFKGLPALTQAVADSGKADINKIFTYVTDILMNGFIEKS